MNPQLKKEILNAQRNEITEYYVYSNLARHEKNKKNKKILQHIANDELRHYNFWKKYTNEKVKPKKLMIWWYYVVSLIFGLTFGLRLMEKGEKAAQDNYKKLIKAIPEAKRIEQDEHEHENQLIGLLEEEKLQYVGSIVLGLNDALVELTGALAGFTLAFQNTHLIAITGLIMGTAASLSMGASEFLSKRADNNKNALRASIYTGITYVMTAILLIIPFFLFHNVYVCLATSIGFALLIILFFTFYLSVAKRLPFKRRFLEMALISLGVAAISFGIGFLIRTFLGVAI